MLAESRGSLAPKAIQRCADLSAPVSAPRPRSFQKVARAFLNTSPHIELQGSADGAQGLVVNSNFWGSWKGFAASCGIGLVGGWLLGILAAVALLAATGLALKVAGLML